jgi:hypothetical protein
MRDVLKNLIDGMSDAWVKVGKYWRAPCKSALTQARQRLGARVMSDLFHRLVRPMATTETLGAFLNGLRIVVIDGTCFDVPDSDKNARVFGRLLVRVIEYTIEHPDNREEQLTYRLITSLLDIERFPAELANRVKAIATFVDADVTNLSLLRSHHSRIEPTRLYCCHSKRRIRTAKRRQ